MPLKRMIMLAMATTILFVQEQALMFLPNIQLSTLLIVLYVTVFTFRESALIIAVYVFLDNLVLGGLNPVYTPAMLVAWMLIPILWHTVLNRSVNVKTLAFFGLFFGFLYGWVFIPFTMLQVGIYDIRPYLMADLPFELIMAGSNFVTILWLFEPLRAVFTKEMPDLSQKSLSPHKNL
ncbi:MAG: hypothetical protein ACOC14_01745 [Bacillota bacterium]